MVLIFIMNSCKKNIENLKPEISEQTIEKNLENDINNYFQSLFDGDVEIGFSYLHKSNIDYLKKEFPNEYNDDVPKEVIKVASEQFRIFKDSLGAKLELKVETLEEKISNNNCKIYLCKSKLIASINKDSIIEDVHIIGISENGGKNFKFLQADDKEHLKKVLRVSFDDETILKINN